MGLCPKCGTPFEQNFGALDCSNPKCRARIIVSISGDVRLAENEPGSQAAPVVNNSAPPPSARAPASVGSTNKSQNPVKGISTPPETSTPQPRLNTSSEAVPMMVVRSHQGSRDADSDVPFGTPATPTESAEVLPSLDPGPIETTPLSDNTTDPQAMGLFVEPSLDQQDVGNFTTNFEQDFESANQTSLTVDQEVAFQQTTGEISSLPVAETGETAEPNLQYSPLQPETDNSWADPDPAAAGSFVSPSDLDINVRPNGMVNFDEVIEFAGNELPSAQFTYEVRIERIDTTELRNKVYAVISDPLLGLMTGESRPEIKNGIVVISGLAPAKATFLLNNLEAIPVELSWTQSPTELSEEAQADEIGGAA